MDGFLQILRNVLIALYQQLGASAVMAVISMYVYLMLKKCGIKKTISRWIEEFKNDHKFRLTFFLAFYIIMILFKTVFCRTPWANPVVNISGVWKFHGSDGKLYTENIENFLLFAPFTALLLAAYKEKFIKKLSFLQIAWTSIYTSFVFSLGIELCQLFFKLGTFQLSDLFFNTLGGLFGGLIYWLCYKVKHKNK